MVIEEITYLWLLGIYGYSYTIYVITTALNVVPIDWLRWVFLSASAVVSFFVIVVELWRVMKERIKGPLLMKFILLCAFLAISHTIFVLALKNYFLA